MEDVYNHRASIINEERFIFGAVNSMNLNEECLLHFLKNPDGLDETLEQLKTYLFIKDNINMEFLFGKNFKESV